MFVVFANGSCGIRKKPIINAEIAMIKGKIKFELGFCNENEYPASLNSELSFSMSMLLSDWNVTELLVSDALTSDRLSDFLSLRSIRDSQAAQCIPWIYNFLLSICVIIDL